jgi:hypothetical protein
VRAFVAVAVTAALAGCSSADVPVAVESSVASIPTPTVTVTPLAAADLVACKAYLRVRGQAQEALDMLSETPVFLSELVFTKAADDLEEGSGTATNERLAVPVAATVAALRALATTVGAYKSGTLDVGAEAAALEEASTSVSNICNAADPAGDYSGMYARSS